MTIRTNTRKPSIRTSWDPVAEWYHGWVGAHGSRHHREFAIPTVLDSLAPQRGEAILDIGAGPGVLAPWIAQARAHYTGVDASPRLLQFARQHHGQHGDFVLGDARDLAGSAGIQRASFSAAVFLLSIQDMDPLHAVIRSAAWALQPGGRMVLLVTHPCFRVPRQSGWGWDTARKLRYRRVDRYLTPLPVPMKAYPAAKVRRSAFTVRLKPISMSYPTAACCWNACLRCRLCLRAAPTALPKTKFLCFSAYVRAR